MKLATALLVAALFGGCASTGGVPRPFPRPDGWSGPASAARPASTNLGVDLNALVGTALELQGVPYRNGGSDVNGFDCSGFTQYVFGRYGVALHREARDQFTMGEQVDPWEIEAGDLLFFSTVAAGASHVAIAISGDEFVHAPSSRGKVRVERLTSGYWSDRFIGARRVADRTERASGVAAR